MPQLTLLFRGNPLEIEVDFSLESTHPTTLGDLRALIQIQTDIPVAGQRIISAGKTLTGDDQPLASLGLTQDSRCMLLGSPGAVVDEVVRRARVHQEHVASLANRPRVTAYKTREPINEFVFDTIETLPQFPWRDRAAEYLERIRADPGIQAVMKLYQWRIGRLLELSPFEGTLLGYNRNKGETIAVKIRTYDLAGFSPYDLVKDTILHELAHMHHSDHNAEFHALHRKLHAQSVELDWTAKGRTVAGGAGAKSLSGVPLARPVSTDGSFTVASRASSRIRGAGRTLSTTSTSTPLPTTIEGRRALAAQRALERQEKDKKGK